MDMDQIEELVVLFFANPWVRTIIGLVAGEFVVGVAAALRCGEYRWRKVLDFYRTNVVPYILANLGLYVMVNLVAPELMGEYADVASDAIVNAAWAATIYNLVTSILANLEKVELVPKNAISRAFHYVLRR